MENNTKKLRQQQQLRCEKSVCRFVVWCCMSYEIEAGCVKWIKEKIYIKEGRVKDTILAVKRLECAFYATYLCGNYKIQYQKFGS